MLENYNEAFGQIRSILNSGNKGTPYLLSSYVASLNLEDEIYQQIFLPYIRSYTENIIVCNTINLVSKCVKTKSNPKHAMMLDFGGIIDPENRRNNTFDMENLEDAKVFATMFNNFRYQNPTQVGVSTNNPSMFALALHQLKNFEHANIKGITLGSDGGKRCVLTKADPFQDYINIAQALPSMSSFHLNPNFRDACGQYRTLYTTEFLTSIMALVTILTKKVNTLVIYFSFGMHDSTMVELKSQLDEFKNEWNFGIENSTWAVKITFHKVGKR
jgi:hypothetical protein